MFLKSSIKIKFFIKLALGQPVLLHCNMSQYPSKQSARLASSWNVGIEISTGQFHIYCVCGSSGGQMAGSAVGSPLYYRSWDHT